MKSSPARILVAACALFAAVQLDCLAFSPDHHRDISAQAASAYLACTTGLGKPSPVALDTLLEFAKGARNEDATQPLTRITHWHYHRNDAMTARGWLGLADANLDAIFARRIREMTKIAKSRCTLPALYEAAGHTAHFIQDMRVPGHAIPIHHGPFIADEALDHYSPERPLRIAIKCADAADAAGKVLDRDALRTLLENAVRETSDAIRRPVQSPPGTALPKRCTWEKLFWCDPAVSGDCKARKGFGAYRVKPIPDGLAPDDAAAICEAKPAQVKEALDRFYAEQYTAAVTDTMKILFMLGNLAEGCSRR